MTPRVSICIPVFNGGTTLEDSIRSAQQQRFDDFEIIVVDDRSTDGSAELAGALADADPRVRVEANQSNLGLAGNWNRCLELASGEWVKFLFQDDLLQPDCLAEMVAASDGVDLVVCHRRAMYDHATRARRREYASYHRWASLRYLVGGDACLTADDVAALVSKHPFVNILGEPVAHLVRREPAHELQYDEGLIQLVDYDLAARLALRGGLRYIDRPLATFRVHGQAATVANLAERRFTLEAADPSLLATRYLVDPGFEPLRTWAQRSGFDLAAVLGGQLADVEERLRSASETDRAEWSALLERVPDLAAHWDPPHQRPVSPPVRLRGRARSWGRLAQQVLRRAGRRALGRS